MEPQDSAELPHAAPPPAGLSVADAQRPRLWRDGRIGSKRLIAAIFLPPIGCALTVYPAAFLVVTGAVILLVPLHLAGTCLLAGWGSREKTRRIVLCLGLGVAAYVAAMGLWYCAVLVSMAVQSAKIR